MERWLSLTKQVTVILVGLGVLAFMTWLGISQLYRLLSTGQLLGRFRSSGSPSYSRPISFESDPLNFVGALGISVVMTVFGLYVFGVLCLRIRQWWKAKPKTTET